MPHSSSTRETSAAPLSWMPVLKVADLNRSVAFYRDVLGFSVHSEHTDEMGSHSIILG